jgi:hypothetical protein
VSCSIKYRDAIETLAKPVTAEDGVPAGEIVAGENRLDIRLPSALREYYLIAGQLERLNCAHNRLYSPRDWFVDAGKLVFIEENQLVVFWGIPIGKDSDDDPPVLQGVTCGRRLGKSFVTLLQGWAGAVTCPACWCGADDRWP